MTMPKTALLALLALAPLAAMAQDDTPAPTALATSAVQVSTDLRASYVQGEKMLVHVTLTNTTSQDQTFSDIASRPHLVKFELVSPDGRTQTWFNTPPETDTDARVTLVPRGQRVVLLQVPSSQRFVAGEYSVVVRVQDGETEVVLPKSSFVIEKADPAAGTLVYEPLALDRSGHQQAWVQRSKTGYELYLQHTDGKNAGRLIGDYHLMTLDGPVDPVLAHSRPTERWDRHVYWQVDDNSFAWIRLQGQQVRGSLQSTDLPYPKVKLLGRGVTDTEGRLHAPVWIPNPGGRGGEVRAISAGNKGGPRFRKVVRLDAEPEWMETAVDSSGNLKMLFTVDGNVDLYTLAAIGELPAIGRRIVKNVAAEDGTRPGTPVAARFGYLDGSDGQGGQSVLVLFKTDAGHEARWLALGGEVQTTFPAVKLPEGASVVDLLAQDRDTWAALVRTTEGVLTVVRPDQADRIVGPGNEASLLMQGDQLLVRALASAGGPYTLTAVP
ncbi:MAG: hypothetical protein GY913_02050 [Proteobacteria bacterium]|nr:hypothetical protein [Pseudomonadota bacterium]MCP4915681.1 hypothetical protein [Pseudomonadota bacterium]